jgi:hypothetical protein
MPFSRSQNSKTAKKSAFISSSFPIQAIKKSAEPGSPTCALKQVQPYKFIRCSLYLKPAIRQWQKPRCGKKTRCPLQQDSMNYTMPQMKSSSGPR